MTIAYNIVSPDFIECTKIAVRRPAMLDVDCMFRIYGDPRTSAFDPAGPMQSSADASDRVARWLSGWAEFGFGTWAVSLKGKSSQPVGFGGLSYASYGGEERVNLGYRFAAEVWGQGLATELAKMAVDYGSEL